MSPEVGVLDEDAFSEQFAADPDEALALLADVSGATDPALALLARRLAGRIAVRLGAKAATRGSRGGGGRLRTRRWHENAGDLDLDASLDAVVRLRSGQGASLEELAVRAFAPPSLALCLVVDRSGSMGGERLATAALAAAAVAQRSPADHAVVVFADEVLVVHPQGSPRATEAVVEDLLSLRGRGTTDLAAALRCAGDQLHRSRAARRVTLLLSDCRATAGADPQPAAAALDELIVLAPAEDAADARALAQTRGARCILVGGPATIPGAIAAALSGS